MNPSELDKFIYLLLIKAVPSFRDSYSITRVLSRKFDIINSAEIAASLIEEGKLEQKSTVNEGIFHYEITNEGHNYIDIHVEEGRKLLFQEFLNEREFLDQLFSAVLPGSDGVNPSKT